MIDYLSFENNSEENTIRFSKEIEESLKIEFVILINAFKVENLKSYQFQFYIVLLKTVGKIFQMIIYLNLSKNQSINDMYYFHL